MDIRPMEVLDNFVMDWSVNESNVQDLIANRFIPEPMVIRKNSRSKCTCIYRIGFINTTDIKQLLVTEKIKMCVKFRYLPCECGDCQPVGRHEITRVQIAVPSRIKRLMKACVEPSTHIEATADDDQDVWVDLYTYDPEKLQLMLFHETFNPYITVNDMVYVGFSLFLREEFEVNIYKIGAIISECAR